MKPEELEKEMDQLLKYVYAEGNNFSYQDYIRLAVFGWELTRKP